MIRDQTVYDQLLCFMACLSQISKIKNITKQQQGGSVAALHYLFTKKIIYSHHITDSSDVNYEWDCSVCTSYNLMLKYIFIWCNSIPRGWGFESQKGKTEWLSHCSVHNLSSLNLKILRTFSVFWKNIKFAIFIQLD